ncbi:tRNA (adenine(58)-N(1))-methyltransferase, mitochondrial isoform X2 [Gouania willdenowi]|uniref:tRNA (adenine(58)-N(1))-methyltransferase, mitochondrial isoform X2 n=1 Tax=Gouania willdenowi TaxID=441366 RepID=UPI00105579A2|nr:tRNA (adenine(58)-N(1))-methyltransferase, mitochondrial isoform X2 [Gouania willdenowi]
MITAWIVTIYTGPPLHSSVKCKENGWGEADPTGPIRRRRSLSPVERISSLMPPHALSPEVQQLIEHRESYQDEESSTEEESRRKEMTLSEEGPPCPTLPGEKLLTYGELLIAERQKKRAQFKKLFRLQAGASLQSSWGTIPHENIAGQPSAQFVKTSLGVPIFIKRASLEDYVLHMKRGPAITYPKDASIMLMMMDINEGDCVLESGSGSGAMSLFLSRSVGSRGSVLSVEVREDHYRRAVQNFKHWRGSWGQRRGEEWPDNVCFHQADLSTASTLLSGRGFHAVALDLVNPQKVLTMVVPHMHPGAVCAVYLANITQVVDMLDGIRCLALPLQCERIVEVPTRVWLVTPARQKDGQYLSRVGSVLEQEASQEDKLSTDESDGEQQLQSPGFGRIPYIARPHPEQMSHTAFLVKLRKYV